MASIMMGGVRLLACLACAAPAISAAPASADAFLERPGEGKIILSATFDRADSYWSPDGRLTPVAAYRKFSLSALVEYGLDAATTLIARGEGGALQDAAGISGQGAGAIGVRRLLFDGGALRVAVQALASGGDGLEGVTARGSGAALDVRLAAAFSFEVLGRPAFIEASGGPRMVSGHLGGARLDLTFGVRPRDQWLVLLQLFNRFNDASPFGGRARAHKAQASVIYDVSAGWSVMAGAFATLDARAERRQEGAVTGLIRRF